MGVALHHELIPTQRCGKGGLSYRASTMVQNPSFDLQGYGAKNG